MRMSSPTTESKTPAGRGKEKSAGAGRQKTVVSAVFSDAVFLSTGVVILFLLWQYGAWAVAHATPEGMGSLLVPKPAEVLQRVVLLGFGDTAESADFRASMFGSLRRSLLGFVIALVPATVLGIVAGLWSPLRRLLYPLLQLLRSVPVMSIILYLLLFVPTEWVAVWVSFLIVFPMIYTNVATGFEAVDEKQLEMARLYHLGFPEQLHHVYLPKLLPYWLAGCLTGMGLNVKAVVTAEAMSLPEQSFGMLMTQARNYLDTVTLLAVSVWIILMAIALDVALLLLKWVLLKGRRAYVVRRRKSWLCL